MQDIEWEDVDIEWEDAKPVTQSVMDDRDGKIYTVPLTMDGVDTRFAIDTQHKGADKGSFFGKVFMDVAKMTTALTTGSMAAKSLPNEVDFERLRAPIRGYVSSFEGFVDNALVRATDLRQKQRIAAGKTYQMSAGDPLRDMAFDWEMPTEEEQAEAQKLVDTAHEIRKANKDWWENTKQAIKPEEEMDEIDRFNEQLGAGFGSLTASMGSMVLFKNPTVGAAVIAKEFGALTANEYLDKALEQGMDYDEAYTLAFGRGSIEAGLELVADQAIAKIANLKAIQDISNRVISGGLIKVAQSKLGKEAIKKIGTRHKNSVFGAVAQGFATEGGTEGLQEALGMFYDNLTGVEEYSLDQILSQTLMSIIVGGITGGVAGGGGTAIYNRETIKTNERIKNLLQEQTPDLSVEETQVMADAIQEMLFQESTGYMQEFNNVMQKELAPDTRAEGLTPEQLTAETRKMLKEKYKMTDEQIDKTIQSSLSVIDARSQFSEAYSIFYEGLEKAGRDAPRADAEARILAARALSVARAEKTQVNDVLERWNLQFRQTAWNEADVDNNAIYTEETASKEALGQLDKAKQLEANGLTYEQIRQQTGWFKGSDNKWMFTTSNNGVNTPLYQESVQKQASGHVVKPYTDRDNPSRLLHRQDENMLPEEKKAWDDFFANLPDADRVKANLEKYKGTPWERLAREQVFVRQAINLILDGKVPDFESALDTVSFGSKITSDIMSIVNILRGRVLSGGTGLKTVHSVNSSFINCNPTPGCAKYCYAASSLLGRNKNWLKPVLIDTLAENRPDLLAQMIVDEFKVSQLGLAGNKAIRLFDEGDGAPHWLNVIKEINNLGYRVAIFTKRKEFAWDVINYDKQKYGDAYNLVMFSSDSSNFNEVETDDKIPVAFVYSNESEIPMIKKMAENGQVRVILPIKYKGGKGIANETLQALFEEVPEVKPHVCPIDAGFKKIDPRVYISDGDLKLANKDSKGWNCAFCDRKGGVGCYHGFSTEKMNKLIDKAKELKKDGDADIISQFQNLFNLIQAEKQGDFVNDRRYKDAGILVEESKQGNVGTLRDVATSETGRRGDVGWLVSILNKRLSDVSGAVRRITEGGESERSSEKTGAGYGSIERDSGYVKGVRDDGRGSGGSNTGELRLDNAQYQDIKNPQGPRGAYQNSIIYLFENADVSTVIHELGHFFLDDMQKFSDNETTKRQLEAIYRYVGSTDGNLTPEQHEYFADSFEYYLLEGRAPNKTLENVFVRFKGWLRRMWAEIKRISYVKLTPEIRKVFDEMLGGRGLDFAMQMSGAKMAEALESGTIPANVIAKAVQLLEDGKMSRADMDDLITRMKSGELKRSDFNQELKKFENSNTKHNERLNPFDKVKYREALARGNFSKKDVLEKINRLLKWTEPRSQNGKVVGRFSNLKMNQEFDHIRELMNMEKVQAKEKLEENIKLINAMIRGEETGDMDRLVFDNKILTIRLNKANASLLLDVYNAISDSYNMGRLTTAVTGEARRARKNRLVNEAVHVLTADGDVDWRRERGKLEQFVNQLGTSQMSWQGILDILSMNDKTSKTGRSLLVQNLDVFDAQQKEAEGLAEDGEKASRFMEKKLKGVGNAAISVSRYVNSKLDEKFTIQWGLNKKTFTKDQLLDIYMKSKDEETRKMMLEDPVLQYNERFLSEVNEILTAEDRAIAEALFEFYDDNYAKINAFYEEKYGTSLGKRAFYSPRSMDRGGINVDSGDLSSYAGFSGVKERKAKAGAVKIKGAFQVLQDYIINSNHWIAWSDKLIDINAVMGDVEVKNIIRNLFGEGMEKRIAYEVSRMASNDKFQSKFGYGKLFNKIRSNYAIAALAAKPSLMIKQLTSFPAYWEHMSTAEFMSGLADFAIHMKEAVETLGNTTLMKTRDVNIIKDFEELSRSELFKKNANKVKLRELLMANIKLGDRGAIYMGGWALYKAELKKNLAIGMSEEKAKALALEKFERVTDETQQSGRLSQQSYWQSNPFLRAFTMFQSSQNQYLRKEINAIRGLATGRMDKKQALKTLFIFHVLLPCFFQYASDGFDWDEKAQLRAALLGSLNGIFILNGILERGLDYALGTADAWKATSTALSDVLPFWGSGEDLAKFFIDLAEGDIDLEDYVEVIRAFGKPVGELTGIPVKYPLDVIQNFGSYAEEGEVKKEVLLWLGWSPYALRDKE